VNDQRTKSCLRFLTGIVFALILASLTRGRVSWVESSGSRVKGLGSRVVKRSKPCLLLSSGLNKVCKNHVII
jgi:hypothetical protein